MKTQMGRMLRLGQKMEQKRKNSQISFRYKIKGENVCFQEWKRDLRFIVRTNTKVFETTPNCDTAEKKVNLKDG